jgi:tRNA(Ile)-lysidine synthase
VPLEERVRATGLLDAPVVVLLSGGRDSVCLLDVAVSLAPDVQVLHVNYGLRAEADADEAHCRALCERLGVPLTVHRAGAPAGNLQNWARDERYAAAAAFDRDVAVGHTATDQVETVLYRLAASPGRRALLGMRPRRDRIVRPLLGVRREETAAHNTARGLTWVEDASNASPAYARNRARAGLVPALNELHPAAEANVLRTLEILRDEAEILDAIIEGVRRGREAIPADELAALPPALRRLVFPALGDRTDEALSLAQKGGIRHIDIPGHRVTIDRGAISVRPAR